MTGAHQSTWLSVLDQSSIFDGDIRIQDNMVINFDA